MIDWCTRSQRALRTLCSLLEGEYITMINSKAGPASKHRDTHISKQPYD
jgi:hypothetical protein